MFMNYIFNAHVLNLIEIHYYCYFIIKNENNINNIFIFIKHLKRRYFMDLNLVLFKFNFTNYNLVKSFSQYVN